MTSRALVPTNVRARWIESRVSRNPRWYRRIAVDCDSRSVSNAAICSSAASRVFSLAATSESSASGPIS